MSLKRVEIGTRYHGKVLFSGGLARYNSSPAVTLDDLGIESFIF